MALKLSVVIPTYNRAPTLRQSLALLAPQARELGDAVEIIVVDDGSDDDTAAVVTASAADYAVRYEYQGNRGPAAARNKGMQLARGEWILFLGDDIYAQPGLLQRHLYVHEHLQPGATVAVLGLVTWDPALEISPFMAWWGQRRLPYPRSLEPSFVENWRFYTCNVSAQRDFMLSQGGFDEAFPDAAFEDTEFALRLSKQGLRIYFCPQALAYHHHPTDLAGARRQMETAGRSCALFYGKTNLPGMPRSWRWIGRGPWMRPALINPLTKLAERWQHRCACPPLWNLVLAYSFLVGRGLKPRLDDA